MESPSAETSCAGTGGRRSLCDRLEQDFVKEIALMRILSTTDSHMVPFYGVLPYSMPAAGVAAIFPLLRPRTCSCPVLRPRGWLMAPRLTATARRLCRRMRVRGAAVPRAGAHVGARRRRRLFPAFCSLGEWLRRRCGPADDGGELYVRNSH